MLVLLFLLAGAAAFVAGVSAVGPAWQARFGDPGAQGTFTLDRFVCPPKGGCTMAGTFVSSDLTSSGVTLAKGDGARGLDVGDSVTAYASSDASKVFPEGGGNEWAEAGLYIVGGLGVFASALAYGVMLWRKAPETVVDTA